LSYEGAFVDISFLGSKKHSVDMVITKDSKADVLTLTVANRGDGYVEYGAYRQYDTKGVDLACLIDELGDLKKEAEHIGAFYLRLEKCTKLCSEYTLELPTPGQQKSDNCVLASMLAGLRVASFLVPNFALPDTRALKRMVLHKVDPQKLELYENIQHQKKELRSDIDWFAANLRFAKGMSSRNYLEEEFTRIASAIDLLENKHDRLKIVQYFLNKVRPILEILNEQLTKEDLKLARAEQKRAYFFEYYECLVEEVDGLIKDVYGRIDRLRIEKRRAENTLRDMPRDLSHRLHCKKSQPIIEKKNKIKRLHEEIREVEIHELQPLLLRQASVAVRFQEQRDFSRIYYDTLSEDINKRKKSFLLARSQQQLVLAFINRLKQAVDGM